MITATQEDILRLLKGKCRAIQEYKWGAMFQSLIGYCEREQRAEARATITAIEDGPIRAFRAARADEEMKFLMGEWEAIKKAIDQPPIEQLSLV